MVRNSQVPGPVMWCEVSAFAKVRSQSSRVFRPEAWGMLMGNEVELGV